MIKAAGASRSGPANGSVSRGDTTCVVTHPDRPPYHLPEAQIAATIADAGFTPARQPLLLPRGQVLWTAT